MNVLTVTAYNHNMEEIDVTDDNTTSNSNNTNSTEYKNNLNMENNNVNDDSDDDDDDDNDNDNASDDNDNDNDSDVWGKHSQHQSEYNSPDDNFFEALSFSHAQNEYLINVDHIGQREQV